MRKIPLDTKIGMVLCGFFVFVFFVIVPNQIELELEPESSPRLYPQVLIALIICLSLFLITNSLKTRKQNENETMTPWSLISSENKRVLLLMVVTVVYIWIAVDQLGFLLSSVVILTVLIRFYNYENKLITALIAILLPLMIFYIFQVSLHLRLPLGHLFDAN